MILDKIVNKKKERLKEKNFLSKEEYIKIIEDIPKPTSFYEALKKPGLSIIGEVKKASPSKGVIKKDFDPIAIAKQYEKAVDAISVLTEEDFFMGKIEYLKEIKKVSSRPLLRKDFLIDENEIYEARVNGASCILLITSILDENTLKKFINTAKSIGMDALVEVHTKCEVYTAINAGASIIGINNRNLKDFSIDLNTTLNLKKFIPKDILVVSESGIQSKEDIEFLKKGDVHGILVGESFMICEDILKKSKELKKAYEYKN